MSLPGSPRAESEPLAIEDLYGSDWVASPGQGLGSARDEEPEVPHWQSPTSPAADEGDTLMRPLFDAEGGNPYLALGDLTPRPSSSPRDRDGIGQSDLASQAWSDGEEGSVTQGISSQPHII